MSWHLLLSQPHHTKHCPPPLWVLIALYLLTNRMRVDGSWSPWPQGLPQCNYLLWASCSSGFRRLHPAGSFPDRCRRLTPAGFWTGAGDLLLLAPALSCTSRCQRLTTATLSPWPLCLCPLCSEGLPQTRTVWHILNCGSPHFSGHGQSDTF